MNIICPKLLMLIQLYGANNMVKCSCLGLSPTQGPLVCFQFSCAILSYQIKEKKLSKNNFEEDNHLWYPFTLTKIKGGKKD